jgi:hypothetical protein
VSQTETYEQNVAATKAMRAHWDLKLAGIESASRGLQHGTALALEECRLAREREQTLLARVDAAETAAQEAIALVGAIQEQIAGLHETIQKMREAYAELKKR